MASIYWKFVLSFAFYSFSSHYIFFNEQNGFQSAFTCLHFHEKTTAKNLFVDFVFKKSHS